MFGAARLASVVQSHVAMFTVKRQKGRRAEFGSFLQGPIHPFNSGDRERQRDGEGGRWRWRQPAFDAGKRLALVDICQRDAPGIAVAVEQGTGIATPEAAYTDGVMKNGIGQINFLSRRYF